MITSKQILKEYLEADRIASRRKKVGFKQWLIQILFPDNIWRFHVLLRKCEYYRNTSNSVPKKILYIYYKYKFKRLSFRLGFSIPENVFGPGLYIPHYGPIVVNMNAKIGANCRIHICTVIGASGGTSLAPTLGDNVYIGPGVKIFGDIKIVSNTAIAANAAVNKSFLEEGNLIAGVPAKVVGTIDIAKIMKHL